MRNTVIQVSNLGKKYTLEHLNKGSSYNTFRDALTNKAKSLVNSSKRDLNHEEFWALKDVSFEVQQGDRIGIIGRNGAGKSTLLKILSRITEPTHGSVSIKGRVASLLEVGTGFHPELTGRENIFLNGAILGMSKTEIKQKFDEIVAFAEVEKFLDTPVKRYSSGMYVRLAFAVAAHLEPEILIVDEVLAVGDVQFQKKCLGKMQDVSKNNGRTVLFVSHNIDAIQRLCSHCIFFQKGRLKGYGKTNDIIMHYLNDGMHDAQPNQNIDLRRSNRTGNGLAKFMEIQYNCPEDGSYKNPYSTGPLSFLVKIEAFEEMEIDSLAVDISNQSGYVLLNNDICIHGQIIKLIKGINTIRFLIKRVYLYAGKYLISLYLAKKKIAIIDFIEHAFEIEIINSENGVFLSESIGPVLSNFEVSNQSLYQLQENDFT